MRVLLTGGTGHLGRQVSRAARRAGHDVRIFSRRRHAGGTDVSWSTGDLSTGAGVGEAVEGVDAIVHMASDPRNAAAADVAGTRLLADAARHAGVRHFVYVSIVGIDKIPLGYYRRKLAAEEECARSGVPCSILRASQFHYFVDLLLHQAARLPIVFLPAGFRVQSVATRDVAERLCEVLAAEPGGLLPGFAGPEPMALSEAARIWKAVRRVRRPVVPVPIPGGVARGFRRGHNTVPDAPAGAITWRRWLEGRVNPTAVLLTDRSGA